MKKAFVHAILLLTLTGGQPILAQSLDAPRIVYTGDIVFPDDVILSTVDQVVREPGGNLYIVDRTGQTVHYFNPSGELIHTLAIEHCDTGRSFTPYFLSTNGKQAFVVNGGPWGYVFDSAGKCLGRTSEKYYPLRLQLTVGNQILGLRKTSDPGIPLTIVYAGLDGETTSTATLPLGEYPMANRRVETGGLAETDWATYYAPSTDPVIFRIDRAGGVTSIDVGHVFDHRLPTRDLPPGGPSPEFFQAMKWVRNATSNHGLFDTGDGMLLAQYFTAPDRWDRLWLSAEDGSLLWAETDTVGFTYVSGHTAYRVNQPDLQDDGSLPNPFLEVYTIER